MDSSGFFVVSARTFRRAVKRQFITDCWPPSQRLHSWNSNGSWLQKLQVFGVFGTPIGWVWMGYGWVWMGYGLALDPPHQNSNDVLHVFGSKTGPCSEAAMKGISHLHCRPWSLTEKSQTLFDRFVRYSQNRMSVDFTNLSATKFHSGMLTM